MKKFIRYFEYPFYQYIKRYKAYYLLGILALITVDICNVTVPLLIKETIDSLTQKDFRSILMYTAGVLALILTQAGMRYLWRIYLMGTSHRIARNLRTQLYTHLQKLPYNKLQDYHTGDLISRATNDIESVRMAVGPGILVTLDAFILFLFIIPVMLYLSPKITFILFTCFIFVPFLSYILGHKIDKAFTHVQKKLSQLSSFTQENIVGIHLIRSLVIENTCKKEFFQLSQNYSSDSKKVAQYEAFLSPTLTFLNAMAVFLLITFGGAEVLKGAMTLGVFIALQRYITQLSWPMEAIGWAISMNREGFAAYRRIQEVLALPTIEPIRKQMIASVKPAISQKELICIQNLSFEYETKLKGQTPFQLTIPDLKILKGQKIGFVGKIGSGKSTFFHLLMRLIEPPSQSIYWKGQDTTLIDISDLRKKVALVEQNVTLFNEDITSNLMMGIDSHLHPLEKISFVARVTDLEDEITELEHGFQSTLQERGGNFSGGQKQRMAISRALLRSPELLLLDDSFSAIDILVEKNIIESILQHFPSLTLCIITHRPAILPYLDKIYLIDQGQVISEGTHTNLVSQNLNYRDLWNQNPRQNT